MTAQDLVDVLFRVVTTAVIIVILWQLRAPVWAGFGLSTLYWTNDVYHPATRRERRT